MSVANRPLALYLCLALCLLAACSDETKNQAPPPPLVRAMEVNATDAPYPGEFQGQTQGSRAALVVARVNGVIQKRVYQEGRAVKEGDLLFQIEPDTYIAAVDNARGALAQAEAQLQQASREWDRIRPLYAKNAVSQKDRDAALSAYNGGQANVVAAKAALQAAEINLNYCSVLSPVTGIASQEAYTVGNFVSNGQVLTSVTQPDPLYVNFYIPSTVGMRWRQLEKEGRLQIPENGFSARIRLLNGLMHEHEGRVTFIDRQVDPATGAIKMRAEFPNPQGSVLPGQFVRVFLEGATLLKAILVPQRAVLQTQKGDLIMVVNKENKIEPRPVKISDTVGRNFLVDSGLASGERIVLEGIIKARPGQLVRVDANNTQPAQGQTPPPAQQDAKAGQGK